MPQGTSPSIRKETPDSCLTNVPGVLMHHVVSPPRPMLDSCSAEGRRSTPMRCSPHVKFSALCTLRLSQMGSAFTEESDVSSHQFHPMQSKKKPTRSSILIFKKEY